MTTFKRGDRVTWIEHNPDGSDGAAYNVKSVAKLYGDGPFTISAVEDANAVAAGHAQYVTIQEIEDRRFDGRHHTGVFSGAYFRKVEA